MSFSEYRRQRRFKKLSKEQDKIDDFVDDFVYDLEYEIGHLESLLAEHREKLLVAVNQDVIETYIAGIGQFLEQITLLEIIAAHLRITAAELKVKTSTVKFNYTMETLCDRLIKEAPGLKIDKLTEKYKNASTSSRKNIRDINKSLQYMRGSISTYKGSCSQDKLDYFIKNGTMAPVKSTN